jgi:hypothetical protein
MSNHVHLAASENQFWRQDNQPKEMYSTNFIKQKLDYIHNNPAEEAVVTKQKNTSTAAQESITTEENRFIGNRMALREKVLSCRLRTACTLFTIILRITRARQRSIIEPLQPGTYELFVRPLQPLFPF